MNLSVLRLCNVQVMEQLVIMENLFYEVYNKLTAPNC